MLRVIYVALNIEKSLFYKKPKSLFRTRTKYVASSFGDYGKKGASRFYKVRVLGHFGKKGARRRDQPYGGRFFWKVEVVRPALCQKGDPLLSRWARSRSLDGEVGGRVWWEGRPRGASGTKRGGATS